MHRLVRYDPHDLFSEALTRINPMRDGIRVSLRPLGGDVLQPADSIRWPSI